MKSLIHTNNTDDLSKKIKKQLDTAALQIRILPMSKKLEFKDYSVEDIQQKYFLGDLLHKQKSFYYFRKVGMNCANGSLVLFQFNNQIVACATLKQIYKYDKPVKEHYKGAFEFVSSSIEIFKPICLEEIADVAENIKRFSQVKQAIDWDKLSEIRELIVQKKKCSLYPEEVSAIGEYVEGTKKRITVNAYERNSKARNACIKEHGCQCIICGFDFGKEYGEKFTGKIHVHHKIPLHLIDKEYKLNPLEDLVPVCPNCHMILHAKEDGVYTVEEVKAFLDENRNFAD